MSPDRQPFHNLIGRHATLEIRRFGSPGAFLAERGSAEDADVLLLLGPEIPPDAREGDELDVFVTLDSEGRPLAPTRVPKLTLGEVAFLTVTACMEFGAFVDWGLPKELLVPFAQQTKDLRVGDAHPIGLYMDNTGRLAGTMRISELLGAGSREFVRGEWVEGEAWRQDPEIGLFVIVERGFVGLVPRHEPHSLARGDATRFRVTHVHPDGKIELSLRGHAHQELESDGGKILEFLKRPGAPKLGDKSDPEQIRALFGLSKKAFKRAVGRLLRQRLVDVDEQGFVRVLPG
ncbi:MAG TPA: S1-like domain-containing RNA-binding protein [Polyangia bacterium]